MTISFNGVWEKLSRSKKYREEFVASQVKRGIPFQVHALRISPDRNWSQEELARRSDLTQGVISRAEDINNGNLTLNTIIRIAAGLDVAFIGKFVPFSELTKWYINLSDDVMQVPDFGTENKALAQASPSDQIVSVADNQPANIPEGKLLEFRVNPKDQNELQSSPENIPRLDGIEEKQTPLPPESVRNPEVAEIVQTGA